MTTCSMSVSRPHWGPAASAWIRRSGTAASAPAAAPAFRNSLRLSMVGADHLTYEPVRTTNFGAGARVQVPALARIRGPGRVQLPAVAPIGPGLADGEVSEFTT